MYLKIYLSNQLT